MSSQNNSPKVSICVISYNQEQYIKDCIESLVAQQADFEFEVVIRDDASSDNTPLILNKLSAQYPQVRVLDGSVNLGMNKNILTVLAATKGEFIAFCEGDDYWIDVKKIQKQVDLFNQHPDLNMCCHPALVLKKDTLTSKQLGRHAANTTVIPLRDILKRDGSCIATPSIMIRRSVVERLPTWFAQAPFGDYYLQAYGAFSMGCLYSPEPMAVYRQNSAGSWSEQMKNPHKKISFLKEAIKYYDFLATEFGESYKHEIASAQAKIILNLALLCLSLGFYEEFNKLIHSSWQTQKNISGIQKLVYYLRGQPTFIRGLYHCSRKFLEMR